MNRHQICCIGHITVDKVVTPKNTIYMPGGTAFYSSYAIHRFKNIDYKLITAVGAAELGVVEKMRADGIDVAVLPSSHSVFFENIYGENPDDRTQKVWTKADPFSYEALQKEEAQIFHLGALLADDFADDVVRKLSAKGLVSIDAQGYLRRVCGNDVYPTDWQCKTEVLKHTHFLKVNEREMEVLTGCSEPYKAAEQLHEWGVKEVLVTLGSMGSVIFDGIKHHRIPAYKPRQVIDATGCGDTYTIGYLYKRVSGIDIETAGRFAAAMSTLKIERSGAFDGIEDEVLKCMETAKEMF